MASNSYTLATLTAEKKLKPESFLEGGIHFKDDIASHACWAFKHIYSIPYPENSEEKESKNQPNGKIAREIHGIQHTARAAFYIPILANLYRRYGDEQALQLTQEDIKLIQIATLFHDSARENEDVDKWDHESALLLYFYLTQTLKISEEKAIFIAEAMANKDYEFYANQEEESEKENKKKKYLRLTKNQEGEMVWDDKQPPSQSKSIYHKLIHDADCLDIIRARPAFDANYLDFYQMIAKDIQQAFDEMAELIIEARKMIYVQGDSYIERDKIIKSTYENAESYSNILQNFHGLNNPVMKFLFNDGNLLPVQASLKLINPQPAFDATKPLDNVNMAAALREGKIFCRAIRFPSYIRKKDKHGEENMTAQEIYKMNRRFGKPTRSLKENRDKKHGNPGRSISMLGSSPPYSNVGYLLLGLELEGVESVCYVDGATGHGKKPKNQKKLTPEAAAICLAKLHKKQKMGGSAIQFVKHGVATHNEILYRIMRADAIYFTLEPTYDVKVTRNKQNSIKLQAVFIQKEFERLNGKVLPMYEYSAQRNTLQLVKPYEEREIISMWVEMCSGYIKSQFDAGKFNDKIEAIKVNAMYQADKYEKYDQAKRAASATSSYHKDLQQAVDNAITEERSRLLKEYGEKTKKSVKEDKQSVFADTTYQFLLSESASLQALKTEIEEQVKHAIHTNQLRPDLDLFNVDSVFAKAYMLLTKAKSPLTGMIVSLAVRVSHGYFEKMVTAKSYFCNSDVFGRACFDLRKLYNFVNYVKFFGVTHFYQKKLLEIIEDIESKMLDDLLDDTPLGRYLHKRGLTVEKIIDYKGFIEFITANSFAPAGMRRINEMLQLIGELSAKNQNDVAFKYFLILAINYKMPVLNLKKFVINWLDDKKITKSDKISIIFAVFNSVSADKLIDLLSEHDVVRAIIANLFSHEAYRLYDIYYEFTYQSINLFIENITALKKFMPNRCFDKSEQDMIQQVFKDVIKGFIEDLPKWKDHPSALMKEFIKQIETIHREEMALPMVTELHAAFKEIVAKLSEKVRAGYSEDIQFVEAFFKERLVKKQDCIEKAVDNKILINLFSIFEANPKLLAELKAQKLDKEAPQQQQQKSM